MNKTRCIAGVTLFLLLLSLFGGALTAVASDADRPTVQFSLAHGKQGIIEDPRNQYLLDLVEDTFDVNFQAIYLNAHGRMNSAAIQHMIQSILEGDYSTQLYVVDSADIPRLANEGLIQPLDNALEEIQFFENLPQIYRNTDFFKHQGLTYAVDRHRLSHTTVGIMWNKDLFEREGLPNLYELYEAGEWTWDTFRDIVFAATRDTSGDGEIDQFGMATFQHNPHTPRLLIPWAATNGGSPTRTVDGREVFAFGETPAIEALDFWVDLVQNDVVRLGNMGLFQRGQAAMLNYELWMSESPGTWHGLHNMDDEWGLVPLPKGPRMDEHIAPFLQTWVIVAPVTTADPAMALEIYSILMVKSAKYADVDQYHDELLYNTSTVNHSDRESDENMRWMLGNTTFIPYQGLLYDGGFLTAIQSIFADGASPAAAMAEVEPVIQGILDEVFGY